MRFPKFEYAGDMLCALEMAMDEGIRTFYLLMKNGDVELVNIHHLGEDDITLADENMEVSGDIEDSDVVSFLPAVGYIQWIKEKKDCVSK